MSKKVRSAKFIIEEKVLVEMLHLPEGTQINSIVRDYHHSDRVSYWFLISQEDLKEVDSRGLLPEVFVALHKDIQGEYEKITFEGWKYYEQLELPNMPKITK